jgi:hypothetical protein
MTGRSSCPFLGPMAWAHRVSNHNGPQEGRTSTGGITRQVGFGSDRADAVGEIGDGGRSKFLRFLMPRNTFGRAAGGVPQAYFRERANGARTRDAEACFGLPTFSSLCQ